MADVIGPSSHLPGNLLPTKKNTMCDDHPDRVAVKRVVGETDSFGSELIDMCQECFDEFKRQAQRDQSGRCDWCKKTADKIVPHRDIEEGAFGRVYDVCLSCIEEERKRWSEEDEEDY